MSETDERSRKRYAGYLPFVAVGFGAGAGGWIASFVGLPQWTVAIPGMVAGYLVSRTILRRVYSPDQ